MSMITKKELVGRIAKSTQAKQTLAKAIIQNFLDEVVSELAKDNRLEFRDFGVFEIVTRAARVAQNPKNLEQGALVKRQYPYTSSVCRQGKMSVTILC